MKAHTSEFKEKIKEFGRELDSKITYEIDDEEIELGAEELNSVSPHYEGAILKSVMKQLDIDSNVEIPIGTILRYQFGVKVTGGYEYIDYGNYIVYSAEKQEDTRSWKIVCYDKMLYAMKDYKNENITFPITIRDYISEICDKIGLTFANENDTFANYDKEIPNELFLDTDGRSMGYTFRDVLDQLAEVTASTICINKDDELEIRYIEKALPSGYTRVDYIEATGSQYINTGYTVNTTKKLVYETEIMWNNIQTNQNSGADYGAYFGVNNGKYKIGSNLTDFIPSLTQFDKITATIDMPNNKQYIEINGVLSNEYTRTNWNSMQVGIFDLVGLSTHYYCNCKMKYLKMYEDDILIRYFIPCYRNSDNEVGMYDLANKAFYWGTGGFAYGNIIGDTIDEEYLKDVNVNFGEAFGPVNTIILSRGGDGDKISLSQPANLPDEDKITVQITDNQIMNGNNRNEYMADILDKLYGLEYYINDFVSTGICYLDLCDTYNIKIGDNTYKCVMFNDEINITQGLVENIYTDMPEESEQEYKYMNSTDRGITQANIIAKKNEATIVEFTQQIDNTNNRLNVVETKQTDTDRTISIMSTNIDPITGEVNAVTTKEKRFTLNDNGLNITSSDNTFKSKIDESGVFFEDGNSRVAEYTKDGSKQKDLQLFGVYYYGMNDIEDTPMFVAQLYTDNNGEECFGHFYNGGDY